VKWVKTFSRRAKDECEELMMPYLSYQSGSEGPREKKGQAEEVPHRRGMREELDFTSLIRPERT